MLTQQIFEALFSTPFALRRIEALGAALSAGELELREVIAKSDDEDEERETNVDLKPLLKQVAKLARLLRQWDRIRADLRRARLSEQTRNRLLRNEHAQLVKIFGVIKALRLSSEQIERMIGQLTGLTERMIGLEAQTRGHSRAKKEAALSEIRRIEQTAGLTADQLKEQTRRIHEGEARVKADGRNSPKPICVWSSASRRNISTVV